MILTIDQIRAARALLNWNQSELAQRAGVARPTLANVETGAQLPELQTLQKILAAFEAADIEFGPQESVKRKSNDVKIYRGKEDFIQFFIEVEQYASTEGGEIFVSNVDERQWISAKGDFFVSDYAKKMTRSRANHDFRILIKKGDDYTPASPYATYRWVSEEDFASIPFHVYSDRFSVFLFLDELIIISLKNQAAVDLYKEKFLQQWDKAREIQIKKSKTNKKPLKKSRKK